MIPANPDAFAYLAEGTDLTVPQAALRFVASHKEITVTPVIMTYREGSPSASELRVEDFESEEKMEEYLNEKGVFLVYELK